jgi:hypothetical protein
MESAASAPVEVDVAVPFTARDVTIHTLTVWAVFMVIALVYSTIAFRDGLFVLGDMGPVGQVATIVTVIGVCAFVLVWVGALFAWLLGLALRNVSSIGIHIAAFGVLGAAAGLVFTFSALVTGPIAEAPWLFVGAMALICGGCAAIGRYVAYRVRVRRATGG